MATAQEEPDLNAGRTKALSITMTWDTAIPKDRLEPGHFFHYESSYYPFLVEQADSAMQNTIFGFAFTSVEVPNTRSFTFTHVLNSQISSKPDPDNDGKIYTGDESFDMLVEMVKNPALSSGMVNVFNQRFITEYSTKYNMPADQVPFKVRSNVSHQVFEYKGSCSNGVLDTDETDLDCGGACFPCGTSQKCKIDSDCVKGSSCDPVDLVCIQDFNASSIASMTGALFIMAIAVLMTIVA